MLDVIVDVLLQLTNVSDRCLPSPLPTSGTPVPLLQIITSCQLSSSYAHQQGMAIVIDQRCSDWDGVVVVTMFDIEKP